jgi:hypothetical protein
MKTWLRLIGLSATIGCATSSWVACGSDSETLAACKEGCEDSKWGAEGCQELCERVVNGEVTRVEDPTPHTSAAGRFTVTFPNGAPEVREMVVEEPPLGAFQGAVTTRGGEEYVAQYKDFGSSDAARQAFGQSVASMLELKVDAQEQVTVSGHQGVQMSGRTGADRFWFRMVWVGRRLYRVMARNHDHADSALAFLDSFTIVEPTADEAQEAPSAAPAATAVPTPTPAPKPKAAPSAVNWIDYIGPANRYSARFPGQPELKDTRPSGGVSLRMVSYVSPPGEYEALLHISQIDVERSVLGGRTIQDVFAKMLSRGDQIIDSTRDISFRGLAGVEQIYRDTSKGRSLLGARRAYFQVDPPRVWVADASTTGDDRAIVWAFLDAFKPTAPGENGNRSLPARSSLGIAQCDALLDAYTACIDVAAPDALRVLVKGRTGIDDNLRSRLAKEGSFAKTELAGFCDRLVTQTSTGSFFVNACPTVHWGP